MFNSLVSCLGGAECLIWVSASKVIRKFGKAKRSRQSSVNSHQSSVNSYNLKHWNFGTLEHWNIGTLELWNNFTPPVLPAGCRAACEVLRRTS